jgi:hypothetical protein
MEKVITQGGLEPLKRVPLIPKVKRRGNADRAAMHVGLGLNALVICIIAYAGLFIG